MYLYKYLHFVSVFLLRVLFAVIVIDLVLVLILVLVLVLVIISVWFSPFVAFYSVMAIFISFLEAAYQARSPVHSFYY